jgi:hypothetical protein
MYDSPTYFVQRNQQDVLWNTNAPVRDKFQRWPSSSKPKVKINGSNMKVLSQVTCIWNTKALSLTIQKIWPKIKVFEKWVKLQCQGHENIDTVKCILTALKFHMNGPSRHISIVRVWRLSFSIFRFLILLWELCCDVKFQGHKVKDYGTIRMFLS